MDSGSCLDGGWTRAFAAAADCPLPAGAVTMNTTRDVFCQNVGTPSVTG